MRKGKCILIGAGDLTVGAINKTEDDFVIAIDGGMAYLNLLELEPDLIIGDFDSVTETDRKALAILERDYPEKVIRLNPEKDDTDMLYALKYALERGFREFRLYAATGGRIDHTMANIQCLLYLKNHEATGYLMDGNAMTMIIKNETVCFQEDLEGYLSLLCLSNKAEGVDVRGMKYELTDYTMTNDFPIGISNEFIGKKAEISVKNGELVCMISYV